MITLGILVANRGSPLIKKYRKVLYEDPTSKKYIGVEVFGDKSPDKLYTCWVENQKVSIHEDLLICLTVKFHDGTVSELHQADLTDAYTLYSSGHRAVWVSNWFDKVKLNSIAHEKRVNH